MNAESPSLVSWGLPGSDAFEWKALLPEDVALRAESWARAHLLPDPHGDPALEGQYDTVSLCLDTRDLDVYWRSDGHRRRKFRIRRYGAMTGAYLEQKTSAGGRVSKRRTAVAAGQMGRLERVLGGEDGAASGDWGAEWGAEWFLDGVAERGLKPAALTAYRRRAFLGEADGWPVRLTIDREIRGTLAGSWSLAAGAQALAAAVPLLPGQAVLELKYVASMPALFKHLIEGLGLHATRVSKYRACMKTLLPPDLRQGAQCGA